MDKFEYSLETYRESDAKIVAEILFHRYPIKSVIDIGCGLGSWLSTFQKQGCEVLGVDNHYILSENKIYIARDFLVGHDLSTTYVAAKKYDLALCLEVAEHIKPESADLLIDSLINCSDLILFSAAIPFQGGQGHVNEQWPSYWIEKFAAKGYQPQDTIRPLIWTNENIQWWYRQNMILFEKRTGPSEADPGKYNLVHPELYLANRKQLNSVTEGREGFRLAFSILFKTIGKRLGFRK